MNHLSCMRPQSHVTTPKPRKLQPQALTEPTTEPSTTEHDSTYDPMADASAPSCEVSTNEFVWRVGLRNSTRARDHLVGECITKPWSARERVCVQMATSSQEFSRCVDSNVQLILANKTNADAIGIAIAGCDQMIASYRRCIGAALPVALAADTEEALAITLNRWKQTIADDANNGWQTVQHECHLLSARIAKTMRVYGCDAQ